MDRLFKAFADKNRLRILLVLERGPLNVSEISSVLHLEQSNVSRHLRVLLDAGLVRKEGRAGWIYYNIDRSDRFSSSLLDIVYEGREYLPSFGHDMGELARCYQARVESSREFFDGVAEEWPLIRKLLPDPAGYIESVIPLLGKPSRVLEIGCGRGSIISRLASISDEVLGVDNSDRMLSSARSLIAELGIGNRAEVRLGDAEHLPVGDSSVDAVFIHMVLHHAGEPSAVLREAGRVLRIGGRCVIVELLKHDSQEMKLVHGDLWPGFDVSEVEMMVTRAGLEPADGFEVAEGRAFTVMCTRKEQEDDG
jgi:SAM-dependent methyltransferase/DNA-binding transcriptional ArsR family regulator